MCFLFIASTAYAQDNYPNTTTTTESPIGALEYKGGFPTQATIDNAFDQLDRQRATQAYLEFMPMTSVINAIVESHIRDNGVSAGDVGVYIEQGAGKASTIGLTYNTESIYASAFVDLADGPTVVDTPPNVLGVVDDGWQRWQTDLGNAGPDKGRYCEDEVAGMHPRDGVSIVHGSCLILSC